MPMGALRLVSCSDPYLNDVVISTVDAVDDWHSCRSDSWQPGGADVDNVCRCRSELGTGDIVATAGHRPSRS